MNKTITNIRYYFILACVLIMGSIQSFAQDATQSQSSSTHSASSTTDTAPAAMDLMNNPWVWVGGGVLLVIILIAIFSGKKTSVSEVTRTTTVTTEVKND